MSEGPSCVFLAHSQVGFLVVLLCSNCHYSNGSGAYTLVVRLLYQGRCAWFDDKSNSILQRCQSGLL